MALIITSAARVNGYTGVASSGANRWPTQPDYNRYSIYRTFQSELYNKISVQRNTMPPIYPVTQGDDHTLRGLRESVVVDDGLDEISFPIANIDTCDCVTFPPDGFTLAPCSGDAYWGVFQVKFTDGSCYDVAFDETRVYANCPSGATDEWENDAILCEVDFTEGTDTPEDLPTLNEITTPFRQQETAGGAKKTRIHLSVHRLLELAVEAMFALQGPWN
ncbi:hypothetical protein L917_12036 [Phytophthora nicotianae]|uniref:Uncharacterized protein n=1 Tax=Phytophthora nicotianae TaxID=4792 RepID=W2KUW7_PHYNI|nr:hypothetical protein L917_12036 [Phytophthora nicotianae]